MNKKMERRVSSIFIASLMGFTCFQSFLPTYAEEIAKLDFSATNLVDQKSGKGISLTEKREFIASFELTEKVEDQDKDKKYNELLEKAKNYEWTLSREKGYQDPAKFPHQYLGGKLSDWKTVKTGANKESKSLFDIKEVEIVDKDKDGLPEVQLQFTNDLFFGYNGIDNRSRAQVRNSILDYTGPYQLKVSEGERVLAQVEVQVRPYDTYRTSSELDQELATVVSKLNAKGINAKVESIGKTVEGRDINAIFVSKTEQDLTDYQKLAERAETEPTKVLKELESGTLNYKVPVMYSNVHADEIVGSDGCIEFLYALTEDKMTYQTITGLTDAGKTQLQKEMNEDRTVWSKLIENKVSGVGYIQGKGKYEPTDPKTDTAQNTNINESASVDMDEAEMKQYYNIEQREFDVNKVLDDMFFIVVPQENVDGRTYNVRTNANSFDLNRDNTYQTQPETQAMTRLISKWNPVSFHEIHGYYTQFQVEPCSPTHEPNVEYDLFMENGLAQGEAFGAAAIANNKTINSFNMPMRDYLKKQADGSVFWEAPFDDMSTSYTPQYALTHGVNAYTVELPYGSADAVDAIKYGFMGNADHIAKNKKAFFQNQLKIYERGVNNVDADETIDPWYVSQADKIGAEADIFRKKHTENNNFFPEYYVIPLDAKMQQDPQAANDMVKYLLRNDVKVKVLEKDYQVDDITYLAGTVVIDMHQAKRNMANVALYKNIVISTWGDLYSEPLSNFSDLRGFDLDVETTVGAFKNASLKEIKDAPEVKTTVYGEGKVTVLSNNSVDAIKAVNALLQAGKEVAFITDGKFKGDFALNTNDFNLVKDDYILVANQSNELPKAKVISKAPTLYVPGHGPVYAADQDGKAYGVLNYSTLLDTNYGWDIFALEKQLGFKLVASADQADMIVGGNSLTQAEVELVKNGKPYIGYTQAGMASAQAAGLAIEFDGNDWYDALTTVVYQDASMITDKYVAEKDNIVYGYGANRITKIPEGTKVLIKTTEEDPIEGFISKERIQEYKNAITGIDYKSDTLDVTIFANTMTNKAHQQDDYRFVTNAIYQRYLGKDFVIEEIAPEKAENPNHTPNNNKKHPSTGDTTQMATVFLLLLLSGASVVVLKKTYKL